MQSIVIAAPARQDEILLTSPLAVMEANNYKEERAIWHDAI